MHAMKHQRARARKARKDERGAGLVEYLFLTALIAVVCMVSVTMFGNADAANLQRSADSIDGATQAPLHCTPPAELRNGACQI